MQADCRWPCQTTGGDPPGPEGAFSGKAACRSAKILLMLGCSGCKLMGALEEFSPVLETFLAARLGLQELQVLSQTSQSLRVTVRGLPAAVWSQACPCSDDAAVQSFGFSAPPTCCRRAGSQCLPTTR